MNSKQAKKYDSLCCLFLSHPFIWLMHFMPEKHFLTFVAVKLDSLVAGVRNGANQSEVHHEVQRMHSCVYQDPFEKLN